MVARGDIGWPGGLSFGSEARSAGVGRARSAPTDWYDVTWNPTVGCSAASPACDHCHALRTISQLARMAGKGGARYAGLTTMRRSRLEWTGEIRAQTDLSTWPLLQRTSRRILVASTSDLFHEKLAVETIDALHAVIAVAHWHRFLVLTKRADRMRVYYADPQTPGHRLGNGHEWRPAGPDLPFCAPTGCRITRANPAGQSRRAPAPIARPPVVAGAPSPLNPKLGNIVVARVSMATAIR